MYGKNSIERFKEDPLYKAICRVVFGLCIFTMSTVYLSGGGNFVSNILFYPDMIVYTIFGLITAFVLIMQKEVSGMYREPYFNSSQIKYMLLPFADFLAYTGFFNIVLFSLSGFGLVEWVLMLYLVSVNLLLKNDHSIFGPLSLFILGCILFMIKIAVNYIFPPNIYTELIKFNDSVRWIILILATVFGLQFIFGFLTKFKKNVTALEIRKKNKTLKKAPSGVIVAIGSVIKSIIKAIGNFIKSIIKIIGYVPLLLILFSLFLVGGIFSVFIIKEISNDFWNLLDPILSQLLTTNRLNLIHSKSWAFMQLISLILFGFYIFLDRGFNKEYLQIIADRFRKRLEMYYPRDFLLRSDISTLIFSDPICIASNEEKLYWDIENAYQTDETISGDIGIKTHDNEQNFKGFWDRLGFSKKLKCAEMQKGSKNNV